MPKPADQSEGNAMTRKLVLLLATLIFGCLLRCPRATPCRAREGISRKLARKCRKKHRSTRSIDASRESGPSVATIQIGGGRPDSLVAKTMLSRLLQLVCLATMLLVAGCATLRPVSRRRKSNLLRSRNRKPRHSADGSVRAPGNTRDCPASTFCWTEKAASRCG